MLKNIETKVELPTSEFKAPKSTKPVVSDEQKLTDSLTSSILKGQNQNLLSSKLIKNDEKINDMFKTIADAAKDLTDTLQKAEKAKPEAAAAPISLVTKSNSTSEVAQKKLDVTSKPEPKQVKSQTNQTLVQKVEEKEHKQ